MAPHRGLGIYSENKLHKLLRMLQLREIQMHVHRAPELLTPLRS